MLALRKLKFFFFSCIGKVEWTVLVQHLLKKQIDTHVRIIEKWRLVSYLDKCSVLLLKIIRANFVIEVDYSAPSLNSPDALL